MFQFLNKPNNTQINRQKISINNGYIQGHLFSKDRDTNRPLIIYSHGLGDSEGSGYDYAHELAKQNYSAFTFNFRHGSISDDMTKMSIFTEENDLNHVIDYLKKQGYHKIYLLGASQGGVVSAMAASDRKDIQGIILLYPAFVLRDQMLRMFPDHKFPKTFNLMGMTLGREYLQGLPKYDLMNEVAKYNGPVLIIHGTSDNVAPIRYSQEIVTKYPNAELIKIPHAGHGFYGRAEKIATDNIIQFIQKHN